MLIPVLLGRHAGLLLEYLAEVFDVGKARLAGDFGNGKIGIRQQALGVLKAQPADILRQRHAHFRIEFALKRTGVDVDVFGNLRQGKRLRIAAVDDAQHLRVFWLGGKPGANKKRTV